MNDPLFVDYFDNWVKTYKENAVRPVTVKKYWLTSKRLREICPDMRLSQIDRMSYQGIINKYAETHEKVTTGDFHQQLKACVLDAMDEGYIARDPTRKVVIKGCVSRKKKSKYLNAFEVQQLLRVLRLDSNHLWDWTILLAAKTGLRFSEILGLTPNDFDFDKQLLSVSKTWDYKGYEGGFVPTKNKSSVRKVPIDWQLVGMFAQFCKDKDPDKPMFVPEGKMVYNATVNDVLARRCKEAEVPVIAFHGLRHSHASILMASGVSVASISNRLGHSSIQTTQKVYLHLVKELEAQDTDMIMRSMATLI